LCRSDNPETAINAAGTMKSSVRRFAPRSLRATKPTARCNHGPGFCTHKTGGCGLGVVSAEPCCEVLTFAAHDCQVLPSTAVISCSFATSRYGEPRYSSACYTRIGAPNRALRYSLRLKGLWGRCGAVQIMEGCHASCHVDDRYNRRVVGRCFSSGQCRPIFLS
jgi:hypothetical protein